MAKTQDVKRKKLATIDLKGKAYATVPVRIKEFREECPRGLIETKPVFQADGRVVFTARVLKDKSDPSSAEATGHAIGLTKGDKDFEKLETIATGRALAFLGYMASGEVASSEEMERFNEYQEEAKEIVKEQMKALKTLDELKKFWAGLGTMASDPSIVALKDTLKAKLK